MLAPTDATILVEGETGTGKDVAARSVYALNPRGAFIEVSCASLHSDLLGTELFGHQQGAFTGALTTKTGLIELADGGTLFLDEIGELGLESQKQLLSVLQSGQFRRVGSTAQITVNFRLIAATNRNLAREVERGRFREDLYYRINVVKLRIPPLRERVSDIPLLVEHFLSQKDSRWRLSGELLERLQEYPWPGNVRQLKACIERGLLFSTGPNIELHHMPPTVMQELSRGCPPTDSGQPHATGTLRSALHPKERSIICEALSLCKNRSEAARALKISRSTLYRKLRYIEVPAR
jgi:two-component system response regulator HydG